jgi:pseudaminic acid cytidylyltransferase
MLCVIPARTGSKRIPNKNTKDFLGKPIIEYSIEAAIKSNLFKAIVISSDADLSKHAKKYDIDFLHRSDATADDRATILDVVNEVKPYYRYDSIICVLYACAPFIKPEYLIKAHRKLMLEKVDCVFPIVKSPYKLERFLRANENKVFPLSDKHNINSQELSDVYIHAGLFFIFEYEKVYAKKSIVTDNCSYIVLDDMQCHEIDTKQDWNMAEFKYQILKQKGLA